MYSIEWDENAIRWLIDGNQYHETNIARGVNGTEEFHNEFFILLNLAIGGNWPGFNIDNTVFPAQMKVDWVRVYQREDSNGGGTSDLPKTIEAETFSAMSGVQTEPTTDTGGGENVGWIDSGDWLAYNAITIPTAGDYTLEYRIASPGGGQLSLDLNAGSIALGSTTIPGTGGWQNWQTVSQTVHIPPAPSISSKINRFFSVGTAPLDVFFAGCPGSNARPLSGRERAGLACLCPVARARGLNCVLSPCACGPAERMLVLSLGADFLGSIFTAGRCDFNRVLSAGGAWGVVFFCSAALMCFCCLTFLAIRVLSSPSGAGARLGSARFITVASDGASKGFFPGLVAGVLLSLLSRLSIIC